MQNPYETFKNTWEQIIAKIENRAIDDKGASMIRLLFKLESLMMLSSMGERITDEDVWEIEALESKLETNLQLAISRFKLKHRRILAEMLRNISEMLKRLADLISFIINVFHPKQ